MSKTVGQRGKPTAARAAQQQAPVEPAAPLGRACSRCNVFEPTDPGFGICHDDSASNVVQATYWCRRFEAQ